MPIGVSKIQSMFTFVYRTTSKNSLDFNKSDNLQKRQAVNLSGFPKKKKNEVVVRPKVKTMPHNRT